MAISFENASSVWSPWFIRRNEIPREDFGLILPVLPFAADRFGRRSIHKRLRRILESFEKAFHTRKCIKESNPDSSIDIAKRVNLSWAKIVSVLTAFFIQILIPSTEKKG
jgi:hypothetical protein